MIASLLIEIIKSLSKVTFSIFEKDKDPYLLALNSVMRFELINLNFQALKKEVIFNMKNRIGNDLHQPVLSSYEYNYNKLNEPISELLNVPSDWKSPQIAVSNEVIRDYSVDYLTLYNQNDYSENQTIIFNDIFPSSSFFVWKDDEAKYLSSFKTILELYKDEELLYTRTITLINSNSYSNNIEYDIFSFNIDFKERQLTLTISDKGFDPSRLRIRISSFKGNNIDHYAGKVSLIYNNNLFMRFENGEVPENNYFLRTNALIRYPAIISEQQELPEIFDDYNLRELIAYMTALHIQKEYRQLDPELEKVVKGKIDEFYSLDRQSKAANDNDLKVNLFQYSNNNYGYFR